MKKLCVKVYCKDCKYIAYCSSAMIHACSHPENIQNKDTYFKTSIIEKWFPREQNKNNNCKYFEKYEYTECKHETGFYHNIKFLCFTKHFLACDKCDKLVSKTKWYIF